MSSVVYRGIQGRMGNPPSQHNQTVPYRRYRPTTRSQARFELLPVVPLNTGLGKFERMFEDPLDLSINVSSGVVWALLFGLCASFFGSSLIICTKVTQSMYAVRVFWRSCSFAGSSATDKKQGVDHLLAITTRARGGRVDNTVKDWHNILTELLYLVQTDRRPSTAVVAAVVLL